MRGLRPMLFGIAMTLSSGFVVVHDLVWYGRYSREYGPFTGLAYLGVVLGFAVVAAGFLYGVATSPAAGRTERGED
ncbi:hypothetical protein [Halorubellus litoreus]|uniref:Uncharacterized protein n=1 Tax=Halorubellus litoreus TaxID=755308 RepID=A0ABD5VH19_9EURY